jgi:large subunit ribosomal protein L4
MKAAALRGALSDRARDGRVFVVESFVDGDTPRTKDALKVLRGVTRTDKVLVVLAQDDETNWLSLRNVPTVHLLSANQLNTYDVLVADEVVFTAEALSEFLGVPLVTGEVAEAIAAADEAAAEADEALAEATEAADAGEEGEK